MPQSGRGFSKYSDLSSIERLDFKTTPCYDEADFTAGGKVMTGSDEPGGKHHENQHHDAYRSRSI